LPFRKDEILTVIKKDEEQWWTARNAQGAEGSIPVPYIEKVQSPISRPHLTIDGNSRIAHWLEKAWLETQRSGVQVLVILSTHCNSELLAFIS